MTCECVPVGRRIERTRRDVVHQRVILLIVAALALLSLIGSRAQALPPVQLEPTFTFSSAWVPGTYGTVKSAWDEVQAGLTYCYPSLDINGNPTQTCNNPTNLNPTNNLPISITQDGVSYVQSFDEVSCTPPGGPCTTSSNYGTILSQYHCPPNPFNPTINAVPGSSDPIVETVSCTAATIDPLPPPCPNCKSSLGDPIYAGTGQAMQAETDYSGVPGLDYIRTYRNTNGFFASTTSTLFFDNSLASGTTTMGSNCYPSYYIGPNDVPIPYCFLYISLYQSNYQVVTADGRFIQFTGQNNAVTQNADINERVTLTSGGWQVTREDNIIELYSGGNLVQKTLPGGEVITYTYSTGSTPPSIAPGPGYLIGESDPFGHTLSFVYSTLPNVVTGGQSVAMTQMTDPAGGTYLYGYDNNYNLTSVTYPDGSTKTYVYNELAYTSGTYLPNALTGIVDESGTRFQSFFYDPQGQAYQTQQAGGVNNYSVSSISNPAFVTDPLGTLRAYAFQNVLTYVRDTVQYQLTASGAEWATQIESLDANGNTSTLTDFNGNVTTYTYDLTRNLETSRTEAYGTPVVRTISTQWNPTFRLPTLITEPNRTTGFSYDANGNLLSKTITDTTITPNVSRTWTYTYDGYGRMLTAKGPRTDVNSTTTYTYYTCTTGFQCGELQSVTDPVGNVTTYNTYNGHGKPLTITDPNGVVTTLAYDARQRLTSRSTAGETTAFSYYPTGLLKQVTLPDSSFVQYTYDGAHRLIAMSDGAGNSIQYTLDGAGNRIAENRYDPSNTLHFTHTQVYNALNRLYQDINAAGTAAVTTTYGYDNNGNQTAVSAPLARNTANVYDPLNRRTQITDPAGGNTYFAYDLEDDLTSVTDPRGLTTSYTYNGFGDVITQVSPDTGMTTNTYDSGGNLSTSTDARGAVASYTYDAANRVTSVAYSRSGVIDQTIIFSYDAGTYSKGHLTGASDANHSMTWAYDALGRVINNSQTVNGITKSVAYAYTNANLTKLTTPSGQVITYSYNSNHQIASIAINGTTLLSNATYEPFGAVNGWTWGNGTTTSRTYDTDEKITQIASNGVKSYTYDNAFRITAINDTELGASNWTYGYDLLDRLTSSAGGSNTYGWTYDANGNRLTQSGTYNSTYNISSTSNQIVSIRGTNGRNYTYDAAGNTVGYNGATYFTYNNRGRMATNGNTTTGVSSPYVYNALGQMIEDNLNTQGIRLFWYDETGHYLGVYNATGGLGDEMVWLGDIPVATIVPSGHNFVFYYVHTDHLNTPRQATLPGNNTQMWTWFSDPFGTTAQNQNPQGNGTFNYPPRFPGMTNTTGIAGLLQNGLRDYDPNVGRYLESDPLGLDGDSYSTYTYVDEDPVGLVDPLGLGFTIQYKNASPVSASTEAQVLCMMNKLGVQLVITGGTEPGHASAAKGGKHPVGQAVDYGANNNPTITPARGMEGAVDQAACDCQFTYGGWEPNYIKEAAKHYHYQNGPGPSDVPKIKCKKQECPK